MPMSEPNRGGRPRRWRTPGLTQTVRVPMYLADDVLNICEQLDAGHRVGVLPDLSQLRRYRLHGEDVVRVRDLEALGLTFDPQRGE